jgi:hypothetical protein
MGSGAAAQRAPAGRSVTRVLKIVYSRSGEAENVQHRDNRSGHGGSAYDDTYSKNVAWKISWLVKIEGDKIVNVGAPIGKVTGTGKAVVGSSPTESCSGKVALPGGKARPYVPVNFVVMGTPQQFITVELTYQSPYSEMIPLAWADIPSCAAAVLLPVQRFVLGTNKAIATWGSSEQPEFKIALFNNFKITPNSFSHVWRFGPQGAGQKKFVYRWSSVIASEPG